MKRRRIARFQLRRRRVRGLQMRRRRIAGIGVYQKFFYLMNPWKCTKKADKLSAIK